MEELKSISYCGLNCQVCPVFIASKNNDAELKRKTAEEWSVLYAEYINNKELTVEDMHCSGCKSDDNFIGCDLCPIRDCSAAKRLENCSYCPEFSSCNIINGFLEINPEAKNNLLNNRETSN